MKVELKNLKSYSGLSRETAAFTAALYIDGKRAADLRNDGNGGCNEMHFDDRALEQKFYDYCKSLPPVPSGYEGMGDLEMNADFFISLLVEKEEQKKYLKTKCRKQTLFTLKGDKEGEWRTVRAPFSPKVKDFIVGKYGDAVSEIVNETLATSV
jgi:hypothetical protein